MKNKKCIRCGKTKQFSDFHKDKSSKDGHTRRCRVCLLSRQKELRADPGYRSRHRENMRAYHQKRKLVFLRKIGELKCEICGCEEPRFLTIAHRDNNGAEHRSKLNVTSIAAGWLPKATKEEIREANLGIQCFNCNCSRLSENELLPIVDKDHRRIRFDERYG